MEKYGIILVKTDCTVELIEEKSADLQLKKLQELVGGYIEIVKPITLSYVNEYLRMVVDENGLMKNKNMNKFGTAIYGNPCAEIVGDILLCTTWNDDAQADPDIYAFGGDDLEKTYRWVVRLVEKLKEI